MSRDLTQNGPEGDDMDGTNDYVLPDLSHFGAEVDVLRASWDADGHVDEGTVHAWLDGAFDADDAAVIDAHVATCDVCAARVAEARGLLAASARILGALDGVPAGVVPAEDAARTAARIAAEVPDVVPLPAAVVRDSARAANHTALRRRPLYAQPWLRAAAVLVVAIGAGVVWQRGGGVGSFDERAAALAETATPTTESVSTIATAPSAPSAAPSASNASPSAQDLARAAAPMTPPSAPPSVPATAPAPFVASDAARERADTRVERAAARVADARARVAENVASRADSSVSSNAAGAAVSAPVPTIAQSFAQKAAVSAEAGATKQFVVTGVVLDATTTRPVEGAAVSVRARVDRSNPLLPPTSLISNTDARGAFRITIMSAVAGDTLSLNVRRLGYVSTTTPLRVTGDSTVLQLSMKATTQTLSGVTVQAEAPPVVEKGVVGARASIVPAPGNAQDFAGRGVAGGIARGAESRASLNATVAASRAAQPPARRRPDYGYADSSISIAQNERLRPIDREQYDRILDNPFLGARDNPLSTFSIDVDRAAFGNVRRFLTQGQRPPKDAVRIEEMINWFPYDLPEPRGNDPVAITSEVIAAPWQSKHRLVRIALQSKRIATENLPASNLVFLIDVSGSMMDPNKLPLVKQSLRLLVDALRPQDRVAIVVYAGAAGVVLPSTSGDEKAQILSAIDRLEAGGSTAGGAGIELAYRTAREHFLDRGNNRVVLATDGDFNVGVSSDAELERLIERKRSEGTYLTVLGFGMGNYQDAKMQKLAKAGNGNYAYIDELREAQKVLVHELGATLVTVANDVKLQVEFNPSLVQAYRLIGYEDRLLRTEDFNDDKKDAGDMGAGHQVTALYEVVPAGVEGTVTLRGIDSLRYATPAVTPRSTARNGELMFVKLRYKRPGESSSQLMSHAVSSRVAARGSDDTRFAAAVAGFGMLMRDSEYKGTTSAAQLLSQARAARGDDDGGYRAVLVELIERWRAVTAGERR